MNKILKFLIAVVIALVTYGANYFNDTNTSASPLPVSGQLEVKMLDVGHGDAILLRNNLSTILVDTGHYKKSDQTVQRLQELGINKIDTVIITHHHLDHIGGLFKILKNFKVGRIYDNGIINPKSKISLKLHEKMQTGKLEVKTLQAGEELLLNNNLKLKVLAPSKNKNFPLDDLNNNSLVFKLYYGNFTMLFTGDIEAKAEHKLVQDYGSDLQSSVLKVAHHGSKTSSTFNFLQAVKPQLAIISCGEEEAYNHPSKKIIGMFEHFKVPFKVTSSDGEITLTTSGEEFNIVSGK